MSQYSYQRKRYWKVGKKHFSELAKKSSNPLSDNKYRDFIEQELLGIIEIFQSNSDRYDIVTEAEVAEAMGSLNKGKAPDIKTIKLLKQGYRYHKI